MDGRPSKTPNAKLASGSKIGDGKMKPLMDWFLITLVIDLSFVVVWFSFMVPFRPPKFEYYAGGNWWSFAFTQNLIVEFRLLNFRMEFSLISPRLLQIEGAIAVWWWFWVRSGQSNFLRLSRRLFRICIISWILVLVIPPDFDTPNRGISLVFLLPPFDWDGWRDVHFGLFEISTFFVPLVLYFFAFGRGFASDAGSARCSRAH